MEMESTSLPDKCFGCPIARHSLPVSPNDTNHANYSFEQPTVTTRSLNVERRAFNVKIFGYYFLSPKKHLVSPGLEWLRE